MTNEDKKTVSRKQVQRVEMPDGTVKEITVTHTRTVQADNRMQRRLRARARRRRGGSATAASTFIPDDVTGREKKEPTKS